MAKNDAGLSSRPSLSLDYYPDHGGSAHGPLLGMVAIVSDMSREA